MIPNKAISNNFENDQKQASKYSRSRPLRVFRLKTFKVGLPNMPSLKIFRWVVLDYELVDLGKKNSEHLIYGDKNLSYDGKRGEDSSDCILRPVFGHFQSY